MKGDRVARMRRLPAVTLALAMVALAATSALGSIPNKGLGIGIQLNYPFSGVSFRWFFSTGIGIEVNLSAMPDGQGRFATTVSARALVPLYQGATTTFYTTEGISVMGSVEPPAATAEGHGSPVVRVEKLLIASLFSLEYEGVLDTRIALSGDWGLSWDVMGPLDISPLNGGVGLHLFP
jgi:hypothetical protein